MRVAFFGCALLGLLLGHPLMAQERAPTPAQIRPAISASEFRRLAAIGVSFDYESSRLALERATRANLRLYAAQLIESSRPDYARLVRGAGLFERVPALPIDPQAPPGRFVDERRAAMLNQLSNATGRTFDTLYINMQAGTRRELIGLYEAYLQNRTDRDLVLFARSKLPILQQAYAFLQRLDRR
jgi:predicted outer membrane protein